MTDLTDEDRAKIETIWWTSRLCKAEHAHERREAIYRAGALSERDRMQDVIDAAKALEAEASKRLRFRDAERYPELCAALTQVRTALAQLERGNG